MDIATREISEKKIDDETLSEEKTDKVDPENFFLLQDSFILPQDLHRVNESPVYATLEDLAKELVFENQLINNSYLNSLTAYDYIEKQHICPVKTKLQSLA